MVDKVLDGKGNFGFNAQTEEYGDLVDMGVVDPTKVTRTALQNAASIAGLLLTTDAVSPSRWKRRRRRGGGHGHGGMGGMGGMDGWICDRARCARSDSIPIGVGYEQEGTEVPCLYPPSWHSKAPRYGAFFIFPLAAWEHPAGRLLHCLREPAREERATVLEERRMRILIAEDDAVLADGLTRSLRQSGYFGRPRQGRGGRGRRALHHGAVRLLTWTWACRAFRGSRSSSGCGAATPNGPCSSSPPSTAWTIASAGSTSALTDYLAKPFQLAELEARVRALTRRGNAASSTMLKHGELTFDQVGKTAEIRGQTVDLSAREIALLEIFMQRPGRMVNKEHIVDLLCQWGEEVSANAVEVYIHRLRKKLEHGGVRIATVRGLGDRLERANARSAT